MYITATELKNGLGKYLELATDDDIFITKNGRVVAKLSNPNRNKMKLLDSLVGIIPADISLDEVREERLNRI